VSPKIIATNIVAIIGVAIKYFVGKAKENESVNNKEIDNNSKVKEDKYSEKTINRLEKS